MHYCVGAPAELRRTHYISKARQLILECPHVRVSQIARAAKACQGGGVGKYSRSNFVHMDCGVVRTWGG